MAHSENTAGKHYYIRKKQLSAAAGSKSLREVVFKQKNVSAPQMEEPNQIETTELFHLQEKSGHQKRKLDFSKYLMMTGRVEQFQQRMLGKNCKMFAI